MGLKIEGSKLRVERLNHPNEFYIYFDGGYFTWNYQDQRLGIWMNGDLFMLDNQIPINQLYQEFHSWCQDKEQECRDQIANNFQKSTSVNDI